MARSKLTLRFKLDTESVFDAVTIFIRDKVRKLAQMEKCDDRTKDAVF